MLIFTFIFGRVANFRATEDMEYSLLVFAGLLPWQFFSTGLSEASNSLIGNERLISKVYFPRMIIPASSVITSLVDFFISLGTYVWFIAWYRTVPSINLFFLPLFILMAFLPALVLVFG
jgi:lipopolysaccharide transport system permease protein